MLATGANRTPFLRVDELIKLKCLAIESGSVSSFGRTRRYDIGMAVRALPRQCSWQVDSGPSYSHPGSVQPVARTA